MSCSYTNSTLLTDQQKNFCIDLHSLAKIANGQVLHLNELWRIPSGEKIVVDYLPPLNADITVPTDVQIISSRQTKISIPTAFDWRDPALVKQYRPYQNLTVGYAPFNIFSCGCAWEAAIDSQLSGRWQVRSGFAPLTSTTFVISCLLGINYNQACGGGSCFDAAKFLESNGTPSAYCIPYSFCEANDACTKAQDSSLQLNQLMPKCSSMKNSCLQCIANQCQVLENIPPATSFKYMAKPKSIRSLNGVEVLREEIFLNGPITGMFHCFADFVLGQMDTTVFPKADKWQKTKGIYVNDPGNDLYGYCSSNNGVMSCYLDSSVQHTVYPSDFYLGNLAVLVYGFGQDQILDFRKNDGSMLTIKYWMARNFFGNSWGNDGQFMVAFSDSNLQINQQIGMDTIIRNPVTQTNQGGGLSILPNVLINSTNSSKSFLPIIIIFGIGSLILLFLIWKYRKK